MEDTNSIDSFFRQVEEEPVEELTAAFDDTPKTRRYDESEWSELQSARLQYLREWEEDMRYAQELASEGM